MHYPSFGHFLLASILAVQGVQSFNLIPSGQVARRYVAPALALAMPAVAAPQTANNEAREPHHRGKKAKKAKKVNKRDESAVKEALEARDIETQHAIEAREPHHRGKKAKKAKKVNKRDESVTTEALEARAFIA
ncbi:hypothetical protein Cob_v008062 [Colletotrichum orbiculare MAFF 240422]|uniref:Uncharacterized protein n=1 Tax=Colletotrichum orbiculare (strain 104-T / ATCC 96160 / CBS 514.97 / LARS 414 / MAFF 240422) TaxID=1213857 RepID=A0A484FMC2_COLOR|nr:hypothetical protein Cob_v008062 [Colletotrichum orbiculare MAFF 240422]